MEPLAVVILVIIGVVIVAAIVAVVVIVLRKEHAKKQERDARERERLLREARESDPHYDPFKKEPAGKNPTSLKIGDFFVLGDEKHGAGSQNYAVRAEVSLDEDGYRWKEFWLDGRGSDKIWLSIDNVGDLKVIMWTGVDIGDLKPGNKTIVYHGTTYRLAEDGEAKYIALGTHDLKGRGVVEYYDYVSVDGHFLLSFERFDSDFERSDSDKDWELSEGFELKEGQYEIYSPSRA